MSEQKTGDIALDHIIDEMVDTVTNSKDEIFEIGEGSRQEYEKLYNELQETKKLVTAYIEEGDQLDQKVRFSRKRLSEVSRQFQKYSEEEIREVYEKTHALQMELSMKREKEKQLRCPEGRP